MIRRTVAGTLLLVGLMIAATANAQTPVDAGYRDFSFGTSGSSTPTGEKPESKLWFNDGSWWGSLFNSAAGHYRIYRFDSGGQWWTDTGTALDPRGNSKADVLWDDASQKLYVASHVFTTTGSATSTTSNWGRLYRYSYSSSTRSYSLDAGFPVDITRGRSETLTIAKDVSGRLFITYVEGSKVKINWSRTSDTDWGVPVDLPVATADISVDNDDISAVVAFQNGDVGVMWSNQRTDKALFSLHRFNDAPNVWQVPEVVLPNAPCSSRCADDHLSLKTDQSNRLYAALKTSVTNSAEPLSILAVRTNGTWTRHTFGLERDHLTRAIVLLDEEQQLLHVIATSPESGGVIYRKTSSMNSVSFEPGQGEPIIASAADDRVNNPSSTKQNINSSTGLLVVASDQDTHRYLHAYFELGEPVPLPPTAPVNATAVAISDTRIRLTWTDTSNNETFFRVEWKLPNGTWELRQTFAANVTAFEDQNLTPGTTYTYRVYAQNAQGNSPFSNEATATTISGGTAGDIKAITFESGSLTHETTGADQITGSVNLESADPIRGSFSARINAGSSSFDESFPSVPDLYVSVYFRLDELPSSDARIILISNSGTTVGNLQLRPTGRLRLRAGSTSIGAESQPLIVGETYRIGVHQRAGTGANAVLEAFLAVGDGAFGSPFAAGNTGTWTSEADRVRFGPTTSVAVAAVFDDARLDSTQMPGASGPGSVPPVAPQDPEATAVSATEIHLQWVDAANNETAVHVYRSDSGGAFNLITSLPANSTSYDDTNLTQSTTYSYRLRGETNGAFSDFSDTTSATTLSGSTGVPAAPSNLNAVATQPTSITLTWTDNAANETLFHIERSDPGTPFTEIATPAANTTSFVDNAVAGGLAYTYRVRAENSTGFSAFSNSATTTTPTQDPNNIKAMSFEDGSLTHNFTGAVRTTGTGIGIESSSPLKGNFSARISGGSSYLEETFFASADLYLSFYVRIDALPSSDVRLALISNGGTSVGNIVLRATGRLRLRADTTTIGAESAPLVPGQLYRVGVHQRSGTGANAALEAFLANGDAQFVTPFAASTTGTWTTSGDRVRVGTTTSNSTAFVVDDIRINRAAMPGPTP